jgi:hypothetical protein
LKVTIFVEGGAPKGQGKGNDLTRMREAFHSFLGVSTSVRIEVCGSRKDAYDEFVNALKNETGRYFLLLVDSEAPLQEGQPRWLHVLNREGDGWKRPKEATESQLHFMAQCVESWLVADPENLKSYYGAKLGSLPLTQNVEEIPKGELMSKLSQATRQTPRGEYHKTRHFPALFKATQRTLVQQRAPHCRSLFERLSELGVTKD